MNGTTRGADEGSLFEEEEVEEEMVEERDSFVQPARGLRSFALRKRKRRIVAPGGGEADTVSICSLDLDTADQPETKKKRNLSRFSSVSSVFSSATPLAKLGSRMSSALQKSLSSARLASPLTGSMRTPSHASLARSASTVFGNHQQSGGGGAPERTGGRTSPGSLSLQENGGWPGSPFRRSSVCLTRKSSTSSLTPYRVPGPTPTKSRPTRYWSTVYAEQCHKLSQKEIKLQEAVFELYNGEEDLVQDLKLVRKTYADSLVHLNILNLEEEKLVFGQLKELIPLHEALHLGLKRAQCRDGFWFEIGGVVTSWVRTLEQPYIRYCYNLIQAKEFLDQKRDSDKAFSDFLQRCLESPFSRKLDLWSYLDVPRSRLVKYPLLLKQVVKYSDDTDDIRLLQTAIASLEKVISGVDRAMAEARCNTSISKMEFLSASVPPAIGTAREEIMSGSLRNSRGTKVTVVLLDTVLVVGRTVSRPGIGKIIQVYRDPIPLHCLGCVDLLDGEAVRPGSFHRAFTNQYHNKNAFRVFWSSEGGNTTTSTAITTNGPGPAEAATAEEEGSCHHTLVAPDEHTKRQWVTTITKAVNSLDRTDHQAANKQKELQQQQSEQSTSPAKTTRKLQPSTRSSTPRILSTTSKVLLGRSAVSSTPRLLSASSLHSPGLVRTGLFRKNRPSPPTSTAHARQSPLIKSSLSQSAMVKLQSGGVKKIRSKALITTTSRIKQDENSHCGPIVMDGTVRQRQSRSAGHLLLLSSATTAAATKRGRRPAEKRTLALIDENTRQRTKSWSNMTASPGNPRYMTRSTGKISKSMSDLLAM